MPLLALSNLKLWVTPLWLLGLGVTAAAVLLLALYAVVWVVSRRRADWIGKVVLESVLLPLSYVVLAFIAVCVLAAPSVETDAIFKSLQRLPYVAEPAAKTIEIPPRVEDQQEPIRFRASELVEYQFESDQDVRVSTEPGLAYRQPIAVVEGDVPYVWNQGSKIGRGFQGEVTTMYLTNESDAPAQFTYRYKTDVPVGAVRHLPVIVGGVVAVYLAYLLLQLLPGVGVITTATAKEAMGQPLFLLLVGIGSVMLVGFLYIPYNTFGEDVKLLMQSGLEVIKIFAILFAIWTASTSIADEIEGKTALTLLSKPISRRQFILGKFFGIVWPVLVIFVVMGAVLMASVSFKVVYDARETSNPTPKWEECYDTMAAVPPGLVLSFLEAVVLTAISVSLSTRLPMLPNLVICGSIYILGHLGALIVQSSLGANEYVAFFGKLIAVVVPVLDHFSIEPAIAGGVAVPTAYLLWAALYCVVYSAAAMLLALILFEDRDLA